MLSEKQIEAVSRGLLAFASDGLVSAHIDTLKDSIIAELSGVRAQADARQVSAEAVETLEMIVAADWRKWEELASPDEFVRWAKSRAAYALEKINTAPPAESAGVLSDDVLRVAIQDTAARGHSWASKALLDFQSKISRTHAADGEVGDRLRVGDSKFEGWFAQYSPAGKGTKQQMREAYEAGMNESQAAQQQTEPVAEIRHRNGHPYAAMRKAYDANGNTLAEGTLLYVGIQQAEPVADERAAFEAWVKDELGELPKQSLCGYSDSNVDSAWQAWKHRAAQSGQRAGVTDVAQTMQALPFAILPDEMEALRRFHECATDGEGYDVPKAMMRRLSEIGLLRRVTANIYEHTNFGLSVLNGDFAAAPTQQEGGS